MPSYYIALYNKNIETLNIETLKHKNIELLSKKPGNWLQNYNTSMYMWFNTSVATAH